MRQNSRNAGAPTGVVIGMGWQSNIVLYRSSGPQGERAARARSQGWQAEVKLYDFVTLREVTSERKVERS